MGIFQAEVAVNNTGKGPNEPFPVGTSPDVSDIAYSERLPGGDYIYYLGDFTTDGGGKITGGLVNAIWVTSGPVDFEDPDTDFDLKVGWAPRDGEQFPLAELLKPQSTVEFYKYLFRYDDTIIGSPFKDKINGWNGDDLILAGEGNDKQWGGRGKDTFFYSEGDDKDRVKDYNKKKDAFIFDRDLVRNFNKLEKLAVQKKKNVVVDFGDGDKVVVDDISLKKFLKSDISFLDFEL